tara:strand:- start:2746 stop:3156 length:411 start_codon:yes stop_codon:yes gene_type:complete
MKSTMGLSPIIKKTESKWNTEEGKQLFFDIVKQKVSDYFQMDVNIENEEEVHDILKKTLYSSESNDENIQEAIHHAVHVLVNRLKYQQRLQSIRDDMIRLQPRGTDDREKGCLPMNDVKNHGSRYSNFLKNQQQYR